ncbi:MAG: recombinase family protein [Oscillospiraceae bacterium]|nr:recombinase family protein [Oscillospiraceae bacterium]
MSAYTIAKYLRLSLEDLDVGSPQKQESNSITNQRNLLDDYISHIPEFSGAKIIEFCDDGWSGKNFERPAVKDMLQQAQQRKIQCIIVKDMSRFGRDYLIVGNYISCVFPFLGIRFIAVNDGVDSIRPGDTDRLDTAFKTLLYDFYSRELSKKERISQQQRAQRGEYLCTYAPYGYIKNPDKKNHLIIDPPAAEVVHRIFQMIANGYSTAQTAKILNQECIPTPMCHKQAAGYKISGWQKVQERNFWTYDTVIRIIRNECYLGKAIYGKRFHDTIGQKHSIKVSKKDWIMVSDAHERIVTQEEFDRAQAAIRIFADRDNRKSLVNRKIRCGVCGHSMILVATKHPYYYCRTSRVTDSFTCNSCDRISEQELFDILLDSLRKQAAAAIELKRIWDEHQAQVKRDIDNMQKSLSRLQESLNQQKRQAAKLYEKFSLGKISKDAYLDMKASISKQRDRTASEMRELEAALGNIGVNGSLRNQFVSSFEKYAEVHEITQEIMEDLLKEAIIYPNGRIEAVWNYCEEFNRMVFDVTPKPLE